MTRILNPDLLKTLENLTALLIPDLIQEAVVTTHPKTRHVAFTVLLKPGSVILRVLVEGPVQLETGPHAAGALEGAGVVLQVCLARERGVMREAVVEVLQVELFSALGESLGEVFLPVEDEMP